jgi:cysteine synthase
MDHKTRVYESVLEMLPSEENPSPLVRLNRLVPEGSTLYAKLEWMNPFGSVKDRAASFLIEKLEREGKLGPGKSIVEPTSGNTGLSLAAIASVKGYGMRAVVPNKVPLEKKALLKLAGAELDVINDNLCPSPGMGDGAIGMARTHAKAQPDRYVMPNQYENDANVEAHIQTTGPEIWRQTGGKITHLFTSLGTCGTVTGCARYLKEKNPKVKIVAVQPSEGHDVPGIRNKSELHVTKLFDEAMVDEILEIDFEKAYAAAMELAQREGLLAGPSSGLIFEGARLVAARDGVGLGVMIFCDNVFKYMSSMMRHVPALAEGTEA